MNLKNWLANNDICCNCQQAQSTIYSYRLQSKEWVEKTYDLVDADEVFAHDAGHLAHHYRVALVRNLFYQGGEELSL